MESINENTRVTKKRHGCVSTWLVLLIISNTLVAMIYLYADDSIHLSNVSKPMIISLGVIGVLNVIFAGMLLLWMKIGFWGFIITSIGTLIINLVMGLNIVLASVGLLGIAILYGILQIKKDGVTAWDNLEY